MAHDLFGERFAGKREPAWHGLGTVFTEPMNASEAVKLSRTDYVVDVLPALYQLTNGETFTTPDHFAIVREPTADAPKYELYGYASKDFRVLQNTEIAAILDPLTDKWPVETVGALGKGEKFFITLDAGEHEIGGELIHDYFFLSDRKLPGEALSNMFTPVRVVCGNTFILGEARATWIERIQHRDTIKADLELSVQIAQALEQQQRRYHTEMTALTKTKLVEEQVAEILAAAYPEPRPSRRAQLLHDLKLDATELPPDTIKALEKAGHSHDGLVNAITAYRAGARELYAKFNDSHDPKLARTAWALVNAVVETEDYRKDSGNGFATSALFGYRAAAKTRAFSAALELATAKKGAK